MNTVSAILTRRLRGRGAARLLGRLGIDARRYWLLVDLFAELSDRGDMLDQLGSNQVNLKVVTKLYFGLSVLLAFLIGAAGMPVAKYLLMFLALNGLILLSVLLTETSNSLVNPVEGLILAHQPVNGATYTAAKLTHLLLVLLYLVPGLNLAPAIGVLVLKDSRWWYPFAYLAAALGAGLGIALACCALFGWLLRFVPARRLKATAQLVAALPMLGVMWFGRLQRLLARVHVPGRLPQGPAVRWSLIAALAALAAAAVFGGVRSLSADFLIRVSGVVHGEASAKTRMQRSWTGALIARLFGGQAARAGSAFLTRMMLRDWQFRRQALTMLLPLLILGAGAARNWRIDVFGTKFGLLHVAPHLFGFVILFTCFLLPYGENYKALWVFLTAPAGSLDGFARGIWASLWLHFIVIPHAAILIPLAIAWGLWHAVLFVAYSAVIASLYLSLTLRLVEGLPFMRQPDASRGSAMLPIMLAGGLAAGIMVAIQYFFVFRSPAIVVAVSGAGAVLAWFLTRSSLGAFEGSIRFNLSTASAETGTIYHEIDF